jgi:hypothetical protein
VPTRALPKIQQDVGFRLDVGQSFVSSTANRPTVGCSALFTNPAAAELAFARSMGCDDWTWWDEEFGRGDGARLPSRLAPGAAGLVVHAECDDNARYVLVTGEAPTFTIHGRTTVAEAKEKGRRIGGADTPALLRGAPRFRSEPDVWRDAVHLPSVRSRRKMGRVEARAEGGTQCR